jgi:hypothetical protein
LGASVQLSAARNAPLSFFGFNMSELQARI